jgi:FKBP-type peptidyl-prolyl cis-trans isomerase FklB
LLALRQYWERLFSRRLPSRHGGQHAIAQDELEQKLAAINDENHALAEEARRVRSDFEHARDEENNRIVELEQVRRAMQLARDEDQRKLAELASTNDRYAASREVDQRRISDLEGRLVELEAGSKQARDRAQVLESTLADATTRLEQTERQIRDLQSHSVEQARRFEASLSDAGNRLESTDKQVRILGIRLENEHQSYLKTFQEMQGRFRRQDVRLNWAITIAAFALLLGTVAGTYLIRNVQKNATLLSGMSQDIKELMTAVNAQSSQQHSPAERTQARPAPSPDNHAEATGTTAAGGAGTAQPAVPAAASVGKAEPNPNFPDSALESARSTSRLGVKRATREDAKRFFEDNATNEGMISLPSGVQYRVVKSGSGGSPSLSDRVVVAYVGMEPDGTVFDETYSSGVPVTFSMNELMPAWREVLLNMREGSEFEMYVPPNLAASGSVRKRSMMGYEPSVYLIELLQIVNNDASDPSVPAAR